MTDKTITERQQYWLELPKVNSLEDIEASLPFEQKLAYGKTG